MLKAPPKTDNDRDGELNLTNCSVILPSVVSTIDSRHKNNQDFLSLWRKCEETTKLTGEKLT